MTLIHYSQWPKHRATCGNTVLQLNDTVLKAAMHVQVSVSVLIKEFFLVHVSILLRVLTVCSDGLDGAGAFICIQVH